MISIPPVERCLFTPILSAPFSQTQNLFPLWVIAYRASFCSPLQFVQRMMSPLKNLLPVLVGQARYWQTVEGSTSTHRTQRHIPNNVVLFLTGWPNTAVESIYTFSIIQPLGFEKDFSHLFPSIPINFRHMAATWMASQAALMENIIILSADSFAGLSCLTLSHIWSKKLCGF